VPDAESSVARLPAAPYLKIPEGKEPYLEGYKCGHCGAVFLTERTACAACGTRDRIQTATLSNSGKLYNYTIVYRSFPGVEVPFIFAIVDLDGGGSVKGNLVDVPPHPESVKFGMPVKVIYRDAGRKDKDGMSYLSHFFAPA
jgi:uncharacterized OB-fold protein